MDTAQAQEHKPQDPQLPQGQGDNTYAGNEQPPAEREPTKIPPTLFVLDSTALPGNEPNKHEQLVDGLIKSFTFVAGVPLELPLAIAIKFLRHPEFKRTNKEGDLLPYARRPKQPDELEAGERFKLGDDQTVANYGELTNMALLQRTLEQPGGETVRDKHDRNAMIDFLRTSGIEQRKANAAKQPDIGKEDFVPVAETEE